MKGDISRENGGIVQFTSERMIFKSCEGNRSSGHCKTIVKRLVELVRVKTKQWSQMQELSASQDFWEDHALHFDSQIQSLHNIVRYNLISYPTNSKSSFT